MSVRNAMMGAAKGGGDPDFSNVTLLLHGDGTNGGTNTFSDSSTNNYAITKVGSTSASSLTRFSTGGSAYFPGGSYLTAPCSFATRDSTWTIEAWCYFTNSGNSDVIVNGLATDRLYVQWIGTTFYVGDYNVNNIVVSNSKPVNTWFHLAVVKNGSTYTAYLNGTSIGSSTTALVSTTLTTWQIGGRTSQSIYSQGFISNLRITTTAVYTANFTPSTTPLTAISGTTLLLSANINVFDSSANKFGVSTLGNAQISTGVKQFGTGSLYFDGSGDYLQIPYISSKLNIVSDFTIEMWIYPTAAGTYRILFDSSPSGNSGASTNQLYLSPSGSGCVLIWYAAGSTIFTGTTVISLNTWTHIAVCRSGSTTRSFINGVVDRNVTTSYTPATGSQWTIGDRIAGATNGNYPYAGYIDELRVSNIARYTANFTPTGPFPDVGPYDPIPIDSGDGTLVKLLLRADGTNGSQTFLDSSINTRTVTVGGNALIDTTTKKYGTGSAYFDGSSDYLTSAASTDFNFDGDFTVECWMYATTQVRSYPAVFCISSSGYPFNSGGLCLYFNHASNPNKFILNIRSSSGFNGTIAPGFNTWNHVAVTRSGSTVRLFVNGVLDASTTFSSAIFDSDQPCWVGIEASNRANLTEFTGYIDDFRIVKGKAVYTANFTPPTQTLSNGA